MAVSNEVFLFSCIDNSSGGTVNWQNVADECGIVSKAAAAIKYKRMKEKFGTVSSTGADSSAGAKTPNGAGEADETKKAKKTPAKRTPKKRKLDKDAEAETEKVKAEEEDDLS